MQAAVGHVLRCCLLCVLSALEAALELWGSAVYLIVANPRIQNTENRYLCHEIAPKVQMSYVPAQQVSLEVLSRLNLNGFESR